MTRFVNVARKAKMKGGNTCLYFISGASVNESTQSHTTPLIAACKQSSPEMVQFLIDQGANPCNHHGL